MRQEAVVAYIKEPFKNSPEGSEKNQEKLLSAQLESWSRFDIGTHRIQGRSITA
jgi:hypothetical protein